MPRRQRYVMRHARVAVFVAWGYLGLGRVHSMYEQMSYSRTAPRKSLSARVIMRRCVALRIRRTRHTDIAA